MAKLPPNFNAQKENANGKEKKMKKAENKMGTGQYMFALVVEMKNFMDCCIIKHNKDVKAPLRLYCIIYG